MQNFFWEKQLVMKYNYPPSYVAFISYIFE